ncbi:MAG: RagB/SusD family nutrient uptake outer membrane protein [Bacteroides sp.]
MKFIKYIAVGVIALMGLSSCGSDYLDTEYTEYLDSDAASDAAAKNPDVFLNGMWAWMLEFNPLNYSSNAPHDCFGIMASLHATDMMGQDIAMGASHWFNYDYLMDNRMFSYRRTKFHWVVMYTLVAKANEIIGLYPNGGETVAVKGLLGQAYAIRGMAYYYLIQLYQHPVTAAGAINKEAPGIPLIYTLADGKTQEEVDAAKSRNTLGVVYAQIESDLTKAVEMLGAGYKRPSKNYINVDVANGLLARYYLLSQQWQKAADAAARAQADEYKIMGNSGLHAGFMDIENSEWMWGFDHTTETQTTFGSFFSMISNLTPGYAGFGYAPRLIDKKLYEAIPEDDYRKSLFVGAEGDMTQEMPGAQLPYANIKFGSKEDWTMDYLYMRAAEMVLIEAEAYAHLNQGGKAAQVMKKLMAQRQPSWNLANVTVDDVYLQRRIELWGEGFAFYDLKRLNKGIDRTYPGSNHLSGYKLKVEPLDVRWRYQLPLSEMQENTLITAEDQNE